MDSWPLNPVDTLVFAAIILSGLLALFRGLVREVLSLVSWTIAIYAGIKLYHVAAPLPAAYTDSTTIANGAGGVIVFFVVLLVLTIISHFIARAVRNSALSAVDRSLGLLFGAARGFLVAVLIYLGGTMIFTEEKDYPTWLTDAKTQPALRTSANYLKSLMPEEMRQDLDATAKSAKDTAAGAAETKDTLERLSNPIPGRVDGQDENGAAGQRLPADQQRQPATPPAAPTPAELNKIIQQIAPAQ